MDSLLLDISAWDLVLDVDGNIAVASDPYSQAQDAASACRLFKGELWYDTTQGIDFFGTILGQLPSLNLMKKAFVNAALTVPGVVRAQAFLSAIGKNRVLSGQVQIVNSASLSAAANFVTASLQPQPQPPLSVNISVAEGGA